MYLVLDIDGEINYKATFDSLTEKGCHTCIKAGFGWSEEKQRCGGFENDKCTGDSGSSNEERVGTISSARFNILSTMVGGGSLSLPLASLRLSSV